MVSKLNETYRETFMENIKPGRESLGWNAWALAINFSPLENVRSTNGAFEVGKKIMEEIAMLNEFLPTQSKV